MSNCVPGIVDLIEKHNLQVNKDQRLWKEHGACEERDACTSFWLVNDH